MGLSRLEKYLNILEALVSQSLELEQVSLSTNIECRILKRHLDFLISLQTVEGRPVKRKVLYSINERGLAVLKTLRAQEYFGKLKEMLPLPAEGSEA